MKRRITKPVYVGDVKVGGDAPITVQSMTKTDTRDVPATVAQIKGLEEAGCEIIRSAVPDMEAAKALPDIKKQIAIPLVADIHFHYQLALEAINGGIDCLRLNPGNIRDPERVKQVVYAAKERQIPIRIGVNFGSLPPVG
ncbi:MAG: flavodoxin-dependent (E)-4-hydroxy-3-methylbut-2-enyl-diphosphate synthase, partial [Dehalococcoidia bacterium]|nr:flavodoxin-dependent (E)-4-hydroxy-3-methylbut-2-enyl-diphosphate synthase [Dehalococcoidia bacterium]